jgi:hypothetical protein
VVDRLAAASSLPRRSRRYRGPARSTLAQTVATIASEIVARLAPGRQQQELPLDKIEI